MPHRSFRAPRRPTRKAIKPKGRPSKRSPKKGLGSFRRRRRGLRRLIGR